MKIRARHSGLSLLVIACGTSTQNPVGVTTSGHGASVGADLAAGSTMSGAQGPASTSGGAAMISPGSSTAANAAQGGGTAANAAQGGGTASTVGAAGGAVSVYPECTHPDPTATCGNGDLDPDEDCDDGNTCNGDGCNVMCRLEDVGDCSAPGTPCVLLITCEDGVVSGAETCDDGNLENGDGCSAFCRVEEGDACDAGPERAEQRGDGAPSGPEECAR